MSTTTFRNALLVFLLAIATSAVTQGQPNAKPSQYYFVLLKRPANAPPLTKEAAEKLQDEHMATLTFCSVG